MAKNIINNIKTLSIMADKKINNNGYEFVDLELPSETLWSTSNVGASKPTEYGLYFQWGDTVGYSSEKIGKRRSQKKFSSKWTDYKMNPSKDGKTFTKYTVPLDELNLEDDAANVYMGGDWHIPSPEQFVELLDNTTNEFIIKNGIKGILFISKKNASKSIFFPATGNVVDGVVHGIGNYISLWTSKLSDETADAAQEFGIYSKSKVAKIFSSFIFSGHSVRGVIG